MLNVKLEACKALEKQAGGGGGGFGFDRFDRDFGHGRSAKRSSSEHSKSKFPTNSFFSSLASGS